jgi:hypothetical protein
MLWISSIHAYSWVVACAAMLLNLLHPTRLLTGHGNQGKLNKGCAMSNLSGALSSCGSNKGHANRAECRQVSSSVAPDSHRPSGSQPEGLARTGFMIA